MTKLMLTSNIGTEKIRDYRRFDHRDSENIEKRVREVFPPEFMNRLDEVIVFKPLMNDDMEYILNMGLQKMNQELSQKDIKVLLTPKLRDYIVQHGYVPELGARPLKRLLIKLYNNCLKESVRRRLTPVKSVVIKVWENSNNGWIKSVKLVFNFSS